MIAGFQCRENAVCRGILKEFEWLKRKTCPTSGIQSFAWIERKSVVWKQVTLHLSGHSAEGLL
jgi:hypothetical protein